MISPDIILVVVLVIFIVVILNLNINNAKKIRNQQANEELTKLKNTTKTDVPKNVEDKVLDNSNYLHDIFNEDTPKSDDGWKPVKLNNPINLKEVDEEEITKTSSAVGRLKKFNYDTYDINYENNSTATILNNQDSGLDDSDDYEEDYAIGLDDEHDVKFNNELADEFNSLSPEMKAFIMSNMLKSKNKSNVSTPSNLDYSYDDDDNDVY